VPIMDRQDEDRPTEGRTVESEQSRRVEGAVSRRRLISGGLSVAPVLMAMSSKSALAATCLTPSRAMSGNMSAANPVESCTPGRSPVYWAAPDHFTEWPVDPPSLQIYARTGSGNSGYEGRWDPSSPSAPPDLSQFNYSPPPTVTTSHRIAVVSGVLDFGTAFTDSTAFQQRRGLVNVIKNPASNVTGTPTLNNMRPLSFWEVLAYSSNVDNGSTYGDLARHCAAAYFNALKFPGYPVTADQAIDMWLQGTSGGYCALGSCTPAQEWQPLDIVGYLSQTWLLP
jgi:hypothetical protein